ncbi:phage tail protein [Streptomyces sp. NPDC053474]|uniref:phage tail protein n=1 Tax=Streptomyces sp. NPDC053474 TaxID=3365704 RepID=UPI0037D73BD2
MSASAEYINATYPVPVYRFVLDIDGGATDGTFSSVSGLETGVQKIEYKDGASGLFQLPGQPEAVTVTLRKGVIPKDSQLWAWLFSVSENKVDKKNCTISLTDDTGANLLLTWNIANAFPVKLSGRNLDGSTGEGTIEEVTLMADRVTAKFH